VDDDQKVSQSGSVRPYLTHQPRSYQIRHRRIVSEVHNMSAVGSSPDLLKKQSSYQTISKKTLYKPKNAEVGSLTHASHGIIIHVHVRVR
jgi:hypothetical protein